MANLPIPAANGLANLIARTLSGAFAVAHDVRSGPLKTVLSQTPTITASSAYAAGNVVGGKITFATAVPSLQDVLGGGTLIGDATIHSVIITDKANQQGQYDLWFFDSDPNDGATVITDKTNLTLAAVDLARSLGFVTINAWCAPTTGGAVGQALPELPFRLAGTGTSLFAVLIARSTPTFGTTSDIQVRLIVS